MKKYQQGDVVLMQVSAEEFAKANLREETTFRKGDERAVLAEGEETGHYHAIYDMDKDDSVILCKWGKWSNDNGGVVVKGSPVTIRHEEHNPLTIPAGYYIQRIVKEYDPISRMIRGVVD